jgi:hypothetical protein
MSDQGSVTACSSGGMAANPVGIAPYQVSGWPRVILPSASLVPNVWEKISIDGSVVNVTKTWLIVSLQTFSASNGSYLVVITPPSVDNCRPKLQTDWYGITPIGRQRELSVHHSALRKRVTALRDLKANNRQSVELPSSMRRLRCHKCLPRCVSWNRQINIKGRTATWFTGCLDEARMFSDDSANYCEAEAAPSARFLGGEIGFKDAVPDICCHSHASIRDADADIMFCYGLD